MAIFSGAVSLRSLQHSQKKVSSAWKILSQTASFLWLECRLGAGPKVYSKFMPKWHEKYLSNKLAGVTTTQSDANRPSRIKDANLRNLCELTTFTTQHILIKPLNLLSTYKTYKKKRGPADTHLTHLGCLTWAWPPWAARWRAVAWMERRDTSR